MKTKKKKNHRRSAHSSPAGKKEGTHRTATGHETSRETKNSTGKNLGLGFPSNKTITIVPLASVFYTEVMLIANCKVKSIFFMEKSVKVIVEQPFSTVLHLIQWKHQEKLFSCLP